MIGSDQLAYAAGAVFLVLPAMLGFNCKPDVEWVRFNGDDAFEVQVTAEAVGEAQTIDLTSSSGSVVVGDATLDPGSGPTGTDHQLIVRVLDAWEDEVQRVTLAVDSGDRGVAEFELIQDSADEGYWWVELRSVGDVGETRTDRFEVRLWSPSDVDVDDTGDTSDTSDSGDDT